MQEEAGPEQAPQPPAFGHWGPPGVGPLAPPFHPRFPHLSFRVRVFRELLGYTEAGNQQFRRYRCGVWCDHRGEVVAREWTQVDEVTVVVTPPTTPRSYLPRCMRPGYYYSPVKRVEPA